MKKNKIIEYKPNGGKRYIKCGRWSWLICPKHLPMTLQKLGYKIEIIRGFNEVK